MNIQAVMGNRVTVRPTKRKVIKTVETMENFAKEAQKSNFSSDTKAFAKFAAEKLGGLKRQLVKGAN